MLRILQSQLIMNNINQIKIISIDELFKDKQAHKDIITLNNNYNQLIKKYGFDYEIWEEISGFMIGGAIEIDQHKYLLKAPLNHSPQNSLVKVYVLTDTHKIKHATEKFIKALGLTNDEMNTSIK